MVLTEEHTNKISFQCQRLLGMRKKMKDGQRPDGILIHYIGRYLRY